MQLGMNAIHATQEWSTFRPYADEGMQIAPPFKGTWNERDYVDVLQPNTVYDCVVSDNGKLQGKFRFGFNQNVVMMPTFHGSVSRLAENEVELGNDNVWIRFAVKRTATLNELHLSLLPLEGAIDSASVWKPSFLAAIAPFHCWRAMDFCGVGSRVATAKAVDYFGNFARGPLRWNDLTEHGLFLADTGCRPDLWFPLGPPVGWINMPPLIAADPAERALWLHIAWRQAIAAGYTRCFVSVGNEVWSNRTAVGQLALTYGQGLNPRDHSTGRAYLVLLLLAAVKSDIERMKLESFYVPVFEWQIGHTWPFVYDRFRERYVSDECRDLLRLIGQVAIAPYPGRDVRALHELNASVVEEMEYVDAWLAVMRDLGFNEADAKNRVHCYEAGMELDHAPPTWRNAPETLTAATLLLDSLNERLGPQSVVNWYGLCGNVSYGAMQSLDQQDDPLYTTLRSWAEAHR